MVRPEGHCMRTRLITIGAALAFGALPAAACGSDDGGGESGGGAKAG
jgi:hypothetical protein